MRRYIAMLRSEPTANEKRVEAQSNNERITPAINDARTKAIVNGSRSWSAEVRPRTLITGCAAGCSKIRSGCINAPRKGNTAPILIISAKEVRIIKTIKSQNCLRRRSSMWSQSRIMSFEIGGAIALVLPKNIHLVNFFI